MYLNHPLKKDLYSVTTRLNKLFIVWFLYIDFMDLILYFNLFKFMSSSFALLNLIMEILIEFLV